jgi:hypothetical protein
VNWRDAVEIVAIRTPSIRSLCADDHPLHNKYRDMVVRIALLSTVRLSKREENGRGEVRGGGMESRPRPHPHSPSMLTQSEEALFHRMLECPHRKPDDCGCRGIKCDLGKGTRGRVNHRDCFKCLSETSDSSDSLDSSDSSDTLGDSDVSNLMNHP